ncbi:alpha/beta hydrolase [Flavilitoribacter nigricans]|uniref:Alpha/beta hydrolase n=1 Tax=Flavilitoribacter nigricans (strain ATCC 23147 / DSM 23189 / NBRC 102662 / NCIMB 1420 / SS-2) TaxID=1122177 RepID=A0A2D0NC04_FLAN2|nr:alpha/beta hydrolase [Flavilitoribacter nigricans]PHN06041.1 alpha/beta hydrolase [Flavilitoribacter nigricans DSM 23189 = NBRC 102662]
MRDLVLLLFCLALGTGLSAQDQYQRMAIESSRAWLDIDYVGDRHIGHRLDIHLPAEGEGPFPIVISVYGSAWFSNNSKATTFSTGLGQKLLAGGFAVVSINHRASSDALFPAQIQDVKAAVRFVRANAPSFDLDPAFIGITGWSSGGHLSALTGNTNGIDSVSTEGETVNIEGSLGKFTDTDSQVDAVVDWYGPTDFLIMDTCGSSFSHDKPKSPESSLIGGPIQENPLKCLLANPIHYATANPPPFLIFHGDQDPLVPLCQSEKLHDQIQRRQAPSELVIVEGGKHGPGVMIEPYYDQMVAFFQKHAMGK